MRLNSFSNEVVLSIRPGAVIEYASREAMTLLRTYSYEKVMFKFNGVLLTVDSKSTVESIVTAYFEELKND